MKQAASWFTVNQLQVNQSKTQTITLTTSKRAPLSKPISLLGLKIDQHLTWNSQVEAVCLRVSKGLFALRRLAPLMSLDSLRMAYYSLVHSHLSYGIILWGSSSSINRAFVMQKKAVRIMMRGGPRDSCRSWFRSLHIITLPGLYIYTVCLRVYQMSSFLTPADLHSYNTRGCNLLCIPASRTCTSAKNKLNLALFNALPHHLKAMGLSSFKFHLKLFLTEHAFYDIDEFLNTAQR